MEKLFVQYEIALGLKEVGYDEPCIYHYKKKSDSEEHSNNATFEMAAGIAPFGRNHNELSTRLSAPLYSQVFKWFREKHNLWNMIYPRYDWNFCIQYIKDFDTVEDKGWGADRIEKESFYGSNFRTYEEAEFECLKKLIEIVKNKLG